MKTALALLLALTVTTSGGCWHALPLHHDGLDDVDDLREFRGQDRMPGQP